MPMPKWKCHKIVEAAKIRHMRVTTTAVEAAKIRHMGAATAADMRALTLVLDCKDNFGVPMQVEVPGYWADRHKPGVGGYFVRYDDGYLSFSPAEAFERGYTPLEGEP